MKPIHEKFASISATFKLSVDGRLFLLKKILLLFISDIQSVFSHLQQSASSQYSSEDLSRLKKDYGV